MIVVAAATSRLDAQAPPPSSELAGTYTLELVDGSEIFIGLPIGKGRLEMKPDGRWEMFITWHGGESFRYFDDKGTLLRSGAQLTLVSVVHKVPFGSKARVTSGTIDSAGRLTMDYYWAPQNSVKRFLWVKRPSSAR
jgi:hypothetical protein